MHGTFTVILDACVVHPALARNLLVQLACTSLYRARWTESIHAEWMRSVQLQRPDIRAEQLELCRRAMDDAVPDGLIHGYESLITGIVLPDPDDRHVVAAGIKARADRIITMNLRDFPQSKLAPYGLVAQHPDALVAELLDRWPEAVCGAVRQLRGRLRRPAYSAQELIQRLRDHGFVETSLRLAPHAVHL
jgi:hypothetical protein